MLFVPARKKYKDFAPSKKAAYKVTRQKNRLWSIFRLTIEEQEKISEYQGGVCAISGRPPKTYALAVDHDHKTGKIRGLLTAASNRGLAMFNDDPVLLRKAADYLENPPAVLALGKEVFGVIGRGKRKKKMIYGSENGPIQPAKKGKS